VLARVGQQLCRDQDGVVHDRFAAASEHLLFDETPAKRRRLPGVRQVETPAAVRESFVICSVRLSGGRGRSPFECHETPLASARRTTLLAGDVRVVEATIPVAPVVLRHPADGAEAMP
jgi:hypothetical protein